MTLCLTREPTSTIEWALYLIEHNVPVFPCNDDKSPRTKNGFYDASCDARQIRRWWGPSPNALIGAPTGERFDVLDIDLQHEEARKWLAGAMGLPKTRTHHTRSGGIHMLFKPTAGLTNSAGKLAKGVDIRAKGGYVIFWPAHGFRVEHPNALAEMPEWLAYELRSSADECDPVAHELDPFTKFAREANGALTPARIDGLIFAVVSAPSGCRSSTLYWAARRFCEMVDAGEVDKQWAKAVLLEAGLASGHPLQRCKSTINSAFRHVGGQS